MKQKSYEKYMRRALELARLGVGKTSPNPAVGAVIVHNGEIIGEGWHRQHGGPHAEVNAINSVSDKSLLALSTIFVTLEPCAHWGKTPPCCDLIISHQIPKVVIGTIDPFAQVDGQGIKRMQNAGIEVITGILADECTQLNAPFFTFHTLKRPYITLKWAQTADGFMDIIRPPQTPAKWFTGEACRAIVHRMRAENDAIMVGTNTVMLDNPTLTTRAFFGKNPLRLTVDRNLRLPSNANIFDNQAPTILFTQNSNITAAQKTFANKTNITILPLTTSNDIPTQIIEQLYKKNIQSLLIEGGPTILQEFINANLYDRIIIFKSPKSLSQIHNNPQASGIKAPEIKKEIIGKIDPEKFGCMILVL